MKSLEISSLALYTIQVLQECAGKGIGLGEGKGGKGGGREEEGGGRAGGKER